MTDDGSETTERVRRQYEGYPYPHRDPEQERVRTVRPQIDALARVNHYCFGGRQSFTGGFRVLVAGGGTGDSVIYLAEQLRRTDATVVHLDISEASLAVAKQRAEIRKLTNITWVHGSLLDVASMDLPTFDYINCTGVLHHLADPAAGLRALRSVLKDDGAMGLMVYGRYGRTGVYQMQELMRHVVAETDDDQGKVDLTRQVIASLPPANWFLRGESPTEAPWQENDAELYDLVLHSQDRAYSVPELYELLDACELNLIDFIPLWRPHYRPELFVEDEGLARRLGELPLRRRQAIGELMSGAVRMHEFHASPRADTVARPDDLDMIPVLPVPIGSAAGQTKWTFSAPGMPELTVNPTPYAQAAFGHIDGRNSLREIYDLVRKQSPQRPSWDDVAAQFLPVYKAMNRWGDAILLRHPQATPARPAGEGR